MVNPLDPVAAGERNAVGTCGIPESSTEVRTSSISPIRTRHVAVLFLLQLGLGLIFLKTVPRFFNDEAWEASIGHSLAYEGRLRHGIIEGWGGMHVHFLQNQIVHPFVLAPIYRVGGFGVVTSRIASVLMGGVAVVCIYGALRFWFTTRFAFLVGLITIFHPWYFEASRRIRPDIYALALAFAAWWLCVSALRHRSPWRAFAAGILGGLAGLAHPTGLVLAATLVIGTLCWDRPRRWGHQLGCGVVGFLLILLPYAVYVLLAVRHPEVDFFAQMRGRNSMIREHIGDTLKGEIRRWNQFFQWPQGAPLAGMMLGGWAIAMAKSTRGDKILATIITLFAIAMPFASVNSTSRYLTGTIPLFSGLVLRLLDRIIGVNPSPGSPRKKGRLFASVGMGAGYAITCVTGISLMIYRHREADLDPLLDRVAEVTQSKGPVYGEMLLWMGQGRVDYGPYPIDEPWGDSGLELLLPYRFRYAVRTAWRFGTSHGLSAPPREMPPWRPDYLVDQLCLHHGTKIAAFRDPHFGPAEIYRLEFDECPSPASAPTAP